MVQSIRVSINKCVTFSIPWSFNIKGAALLSTCTESNQRPQDLKWIMQIEPCIVDQIEDIVDQIEDISDNFFSGFPLTLFMKAKLFEQEVLHLYPVAEFWSLSTMLWAQRDFLNLSESWDGHHKDPGSLRRPLPCSATESVFFKAPCITSSFWPASSMWHQSCSLAPSAFFEQRTLTPAKHFLEQQCK